MPSMTGDIGLFNFILHTAYQYTRDIQGVTARPGARFGPGGIRQGSRRIRPDGAWSIYTGENVFASWASIVDCGDVPLTFLDNTVALKQLGKAHKVSFVIINRSHGQGFPITHIRISFDK